MKTVLALCAALVLGGCASISQVAVETARGAERGVIAGVSAVRPEVCHTDATCAPMVAVTPIGGAVIGGAQGFARGVAQAQRQRQPPD